MDARTTTHTTPPDRGLRAARLALALAEELPTELAAKIGARLADLPVEWFAYHRELLEAVGPIADRRTPATRGLELLDNAEAALVAGLRSILEGESELETFARMRRVGVPDGLLRDYFSRPRFDRLEVPA